MNKAQTSEKLIVVTGGSKGIGRAVVARFLKAGFPVATCARSATDLAALTTELHADVPGAVLHTLPADLSQQADCARFAEFVLALGLPVDVLVNNAGAFIPGRLQDEPADGSQLRQMLAVNLLSAYDVTLPLLPGLIARGQGHIFTICSTASITAYPNGGSYGIAKHALLGFTKNLREELKTSGVRVTAVLPGPTLTASWAGVELPAERFVQADDVAEALFSAYSLSLHAVVEELLIRPQLGDLG
ncbi:SDR family oxidoreductase [Hymenobacter siberiensis]|jgi:short-subunit dehydrogenase|uniref:SDR family oxidoreductase n=1 Tax=Hymenobacter siberiensis TaxID=2848396 RepID=UPI001C1E5A44|nr:SDR family NAD(P)-dependent oxidoreductase [Hymenobacter siberiensis]MBU6121485.1 SDR family NAD(P)-dependent oxidoreductase [Hymenobacter siberiensis]